MKFTSFAAMRRYCATHRAEEIKRTVAALNTLIHTGVLPNPPPWVGQERWAAMLKRIMTDEGEILV